MLLATAASSLMQTFLTVSLPTVTAELDPIAWLRTMASHASPTSGHTTQLCDPRGAGQRLELGRRGKE